MPARRPSLGSSSTPPGGTSGDVSIFSNGQVTAEGSEAPFPEDSSDDDDVEEVEGGGIRSPRSNNNAAIGGAGGLQQQLQRPPPPSRQEEETEEDLVTVEADSAPYPESDDDEDNGGGRRGSSGGNRQDLALRPTAPATTTTTTTTTNVPTIYPGAVRVPGPGNPSAATIISTKTTSASSPPTAPLPVLSSTPTVHASPVEDDEADGVVEQDLEDVPLPAGVEELIQRRLREETVPAGTVTKVDSNNTPPHDDEDKLLVTKNIALIIILLCIIGAIIVGVVIAVSKGKGNGTARDESNGRGKYLMNLLEPLYGESSEVFQKGTSTQALAFEWMTIVDEYYYNATTDSYDINARPQSVGNNNTSAEATEVVLTWKEEFDTQLLERYAAVVLYYSTNSSTNSDENYVGWNDPVGFLNSTSSICTWNTNPPKSDDVESALTTNVTFVRGIACDNSGRASMIELSKSKKKAFCV